MSEIILTRTGKDRIRYAVMFEVCLMIMLVPAGAVFFDKGWADIGLLGVILSLKALLLSLAYNWAFDRYDARRGRISSERSWLGRLIHAVGFEGSLTLTSIPFYVWLLKITAWEAFATDIIVTTFVVAFTYIFTLGYDRVYPLTAKTLS